MGLLRYVKGQNRLCLMGAAPQECLNALTKANVPFWDIEPKDELHCYISVAQKHTKRVEEIARKCFCDVVSLSQRGLQQDLKRAKKRPVLVFGLALILFLSFYLQSYIWVIEIDGCETLHDEVLVQALQELGVSVGSRASELDTKLIRHRLLNSLPELSWVAVNRTGGRLCVLACGREVETSEQAPYAAANLVAVRDAVITQMNISEGMRLCQVGETVKAGQVLVSGFEDYGLCLKAVCAAGEIYGQTWYTGTIVTPSISMKKSYTGRTWTQRTLIVGRKRINLSGNSSILGTLCDKMIDRTQLTLPEYRFPVILETVTYSEYELVQESVSREQAQRMLSEAWRRNLLSGTVAGKIEQTESTCIESGGLYVMRAKSICNELLSRLQPMQVPYGGENE